MSCLSKQHSDEFSVAVCIDCLENVPDAAELELLDANFDMLFRLMLDELAAISEED